MEADQGLSMEMTWKVVAANERYFDAIATTYDRDPAQRYGSYHRNSKERYRAFLRANLHRVNRGVVVNLGCGTGNMMEIESEFGLRPIGIDISTGMLREARRMSDRLVRADVHRLPLPDGSVSLASCFLLLHHVYDHRLLFEELFRVLMPGGVLFSDYDPNFYPSSLAKRHWLFKPLWLLRRFLSYRVMKVGKVIDLETARLADYYSETVPGLKGEEIAGALQESGFTSVQAVAHSDGTSLVRPNRGRVFHKAFEGLLWFLGEKDYRRRAKILAVIAQKPGGDEGITLS